MLMFGFVIDSEFDEDEDATVVAVTSTGFIVERAQRSVTCHREAGWKFGRTQLRALGDFVESRYRHAPQDSGFVLGPMLVDVGVDVDDADRAVAEFVRCVHRRNGMLGSVEEFERRSLPAPTQTTGSLQSVTTPDGRAYKPRIIGGFRDVDVVRSAALSHAPILLRGPYGTGKSTLVSAAVGDDVVSIRCYEGIGREDVVGMHTPTPDHPGEFTWVDAPLVRAMTQGRPCHIEDIGWMAPGVQAILLPLAAEDRQLEIVDRPESTVVAAPGFSLIISENPGVGWGVIGPLHDRMALCVDVPVDYAIAGSEGAPPFLVESAAARQKRARDTDDTSMWLPSIRELLAARDTEAMFGPQFAAQALISKCPPDQRDQYTQELAKFMDVAGPLRSSGL